MNPAMHIKLFATGAIPHDNAFSWDTDSIPVVMDNCATAIICKHRRLFTGKFTPTSVTLETAEGTSTKTHLVGSLRLVLTDDCNEHHSYVVPNCVFDPDTPMNIFGIPALGAFFNDSATADSPHNKE